MIWPATSSSSNSFCTAGISLDFSSMSICASTNAVSTANALSTCFALASLKLSKLPLSALPSNAITRAPGSSVFLTPSGVFTGSTVLATGVGNVETYGSPGGNTFSGNLYQVPASSLQFYTAPGATSGGISLSTSGNYNVASYTLLNGSVPPSQPFGTAAVGAFGASALAFTKNVSGTNVGLGGVFGQTVLPGTTAGYVVSANGQS